MVRLVGIDAEQKTDIIEQGGNDYISKMWETWFALVNETMFGSDARAKYDNVLFTMPYLPIPLYHKVVSTLSILLPAWPTIYN
jgi:hypothetical protein